MVTTFNAAGYEQYGRKMLETFLRHWPVEVTVYVYAEGFSPDITDQRIIYRDLLADSPELVAFKSRHQNNPAAHGDLLRYRWEFYTKSKIPWFKIRRVGWGMGSNWDAVRFSHKSFSIFAAAERCTADILFWVDGDSLFFADIPLDFLESLVPPGVMLSYLAREDYTECGFVAYNLTHPAIRSFLAQFKELYTNDTLFDQREYHDSYLFDVVRRHFEKLGNKTYDIAEGLGCQSRHVLINSRLGRYMDHLKGDRKIEKKSYAEDLVAPRKERYWKEQA